MFNPKTMENSEISLPERKDCSYGRRCYRKNPAHFVEYAHPHLEEVALKINEGALDDVISAGHDSGFLEQAQCVAELLSNGEITVKVNEENNKLNKPGPSEASAEPPFKRSKLDSSPLDSEVENKPETLIRTVYDKIEASSPVRYFLSTVEGSFETQSDPLALTFSDILDPSLGELEESVQFNFMVEVGWLLAQYIRHGYHRKKLLIIYGDDTEELRTISSRVPTLTTARVKPKYPFGHHHTKMSIMYYSDKSLRVVVHTGNLIESDWEHRTQGLWISPRCPEKTGTDDDDSVTGFKKDILRYLGEYPVQELQPWMERIRNSDFSQINVCFIPSVPGSFAGRDAAWGHSYLSQLLKKHVVFTEDDNSTSWHTIAQCSSIGSLGGGPQDWLLGELGQSMAACQGKLQSSDVKVIFPSFKNVSGSIDGVLGGGCLPYTTKSHQKQLWFTSYLYQWRSESRKRTRAMPHIKTYTRISSDYKKSAWFILSSANLSKAAWGMRTKSGSLMIQSYEAGVLFLPKFLNCKGLFEIGRDIKLPFDVPPTKYGEDDEPWFIDHLRSLR